MAEHVSVLEAVDAAGANVLSTRREGTCGTCEVRRLEGIPEHRDSLLSLEERLENASMMTCVSRCRPPRLILDLQPIRGLPLLGTLARRPEAARRGKRVSTAVGERLALRAPRVAMLPGTQAG